MLSRPTFFLWFSIKVDGDHKFRLSFPVPIYTLFLLADLVEDFACIWRLFGGKKAKAARWQHNSAVTKENFVEKLKNPSPEVLSSAAGVAKQLLVSLCFRSGACDLLDVDFASDNEHIQVKCLLR